MTLIEALREAMTTFFESVEQTEIIYAIYTDEALRIDNTLIDIPIDMVDIPKIFSQQGMELDLSLGGGSIQKAVMKDPLTYGDKVAVAVHHQGKRYSVLYKL